MASIRSWTQTAVARAWTDDPSTASPDNVRQLLGWLGDREAQLELAVEAADLGLWHWNPKTGELLWSDRCRSLIGVGPDVHADFDAFMAQVEPDDRTIIAHAVQTALDTGGGYSEEFRVRLPDSSIRWLHTLGKAELSSITGKAQRMSGVVRDITESRARRVESKPPASEVPAPGQMLRHMAEASTTGLLATDPLGIVIDANRAWLALATTQREVVAGRNWLDFVHADDRARVRSAWAAMTHDAPLDEALRFHTTEPSSRWVRARAAPTNDDSHPSTGYVISCTDITEHTRDLAVASRSLTRIRELSRRVQALRGIERAEVAGRLQQALYQDLIELRLSLQGLLNTGVHRTVVRVELERLSDLSSAALNSLRGVVFDLVPLSTEELGFEFSVKRFATELAERAGMRCRVHFPAEPIQAPQSTLETLFMVAQEALTNAVRHSRAGSVDVFVEALIDSVRLRVVDNGVGMTSQDRERPGHLGLLAAAEQLTPLGGTLRLTSMVGHGTTLEATVPVRRDPSLPAAEGYWL